LREFLGKRVKDGVIVRAIGKWLNAGVLEKGQLSYPEAGTPQGGVISPILANIYLHEVLDVWFTRDVLPRLRGRAVLVRYADDFVIMCQLREDAERVMEVLPKRFGKYGLSLHPAKTRIVGFEEPRGSQATEVRRSTFDFLGFTHYWGKSLRKRWMVRRKTARDRLSRTIGRVWEWCKANRHLPIRTQHRSLVLKLRGHYGYFGVTGNERALRGLREATRRAWRYWLSHRGGKRRMTWPRFQALLAYFSLPYPRLARSTVNRGD
jgi:group II intron reverse transcriptase/maturase